MSANPLKRLNNQMLGEISARFRALGEVNRLRIVQALHLGEMCVNEIVESTGLSQPNVSRHLSVLLNVNLIGRRKAGQNVLYYIVDDNLMQICEIVCKSVRSK